MLKTQLSCSQNHIPGIEMKIEKKKKNAYFELNRIVRDRSNSLKCIKR